MALDPLRTSDDYHATSHMKIGCGVWFTDKKSTLAKITDLFILTKIVVKTWSLVSLFLV